MKRMMLAVPVLALVAGLAVSQSLAQAAPAAAPAAAPLVAAPVRPVGPPQQVDLATAKKIVAAAEAAAAAQNQHVAICVMDARGDLVMFERMDTINTIPVGSAQAKAHAVLLFGIPTSQLATAMKNGTQIAPPTKAPLTGYAEIDMRSGGLPIMKNGKMIGSIGVGGSASETDEAFAQAGLDALK